MANLIERLWSKMKKNELKGWSKYRELLERADSPRTGDEDELQALMRELQIDRRAVHQHAAAVKQHQQLTADGEKLAELQKRHEANEAAEVKASDEFKELIKAEKAKLHALGAKSWETRYPFHAARDAVRVRVNLENRFPELFGITVLPKMIVPEKSRLQVEAESTLLAASDFMAGKPAFERLGGMMRKLRGEQLARSFRSAHKQWTDDQVDARVADALAAETRAFVPAELKAMPADEIDASEDRL